MEDPLLIQDEDIESTQKNSQKKTYQAEWTRYYILIMFALVNCNQCLAWFTFRYDKTFVVSSIFLRTKTHTLNQLGGSGKDQRLFW